MEDATRPVDSLGEKPTSPWIAEAMAFGIGLFLAFSEILIRLVTGKDIVDAVWPHAVRSLDWTMLLRETPTLPFTLFLIGGAVAYGGRQWMLQQKRREVGIALNGLIGLLVGFITLHFLLDSFYLRGAFLLLPTLMGWWLAMLLVARGGMPTWRSRDEDGVSWIHISHLLGVFFAAWLVMPGIPALIGFAPAPPNAPAIGYGAAAGPNEVVQFSSPYTLPFEVTEVQGDLENDVEFSVYITLPILPEDFPFSHIPLAILLHGFGYPDVDAYQNWIAHLSAKGMAVAFIQYPSDLRPSGHETFVEQEREGTSDFLQHTYRNLSIRAGIEHIDQILLGEQRDERVDTHLGDTAVDPASLWVGGHSLGAAYTFFTLDEAFERGWGQHALVVALEAPASRPMQQDLQPDLSALPDEALIQISVSEDDMSVGMCPGAFHQQLFNELPEERNQLIVVRTDKYGFPRLVASHYMQTDPAHDSLSDWGFYRRIDAQADYIVAHSRNDTFTSDFAFHYMTDETMLTNMGQWEDGTPVLPLGLYHDAVNTDANFAQCR